MADFHTYETTGNKETTSKPRQKAGTRKAAFFSLPVKNPPIHPVFVSFFTTHKFYCVRVARKKSSRRTSTGAGHVLMGLPLIYGSPSRRGESEPYPGGRLSTLRFSSCGQEHRFHLHQVHLFCPQTVRCWMRANWVSFLRHSLRHFREGNLVYFMGEFLL